MATHLSSAQLRDLEISIADRIYLQVQKWNLYLGDAGLSKALAIECQANLDKGSREASKKAFEAVIVRLGGGNTEIPLSKLISSGQVFELEEIFEGK